MGLLKNMVRNMRDKKTMLATAQSQDRVQTLVQERKKTSDERELERRLEEQRQKNITEQLRAMRKAETRSAMTDNSLLKQKNIFKGKSTMLNNNPKLFSPKHNKLINHKGGMR